MMEAAGTSIAFNAKPIVQASAAYTIDERDLSLVMPIIRSTLQAS
jgi:phosphoserine phosphatase